MTFRKSILLLIGLSMLAALVACGSSNHTTTTPPPTITISLSAFTGPLAVNSQTPITATTTDTAGVNWSVTCASTSGVCGTFTSSQTATTVANNYIAPPIPTTGVVITATSVTTSSVTASTSPAVAITGATLADGSYVFSLAGVNANGNGLGKPGNYYVAGEFTIAGGVITQGEQDFVDLLHDQFDAINGTTAPGKITMSERPRIGSTSGRERVDRRGGTSDLSPDPRMLTKSVSDVVIVFRSEIYTRAR